MTAAGQHRWRNARPAPPCKWLDPDQPPVARIRGYRCTGGARISVERDGRVRRYRVSLARWHRLQDWAAFGPHPWASGGWWGASSFEAQLLTARRAS